MFSLPVFTFLDAMTSTLFNWLWILKNVLMILLYFFYVNSYHIYLTSALTYGSSQIRLNYCLVHGLFIGERCALWQNDLSSFSALPRISIGIGEIKQQLKYLFFFAATLTQSSSSHVLPSLSTIKNKFCL